MIGDENMNCDVLVVGAGPTGLVLALWLAKSGVRVRIIDRTVTSGTTSRALAVQARTLELYRQLNLTEAVISNGHKVPAVNLWARGEPVGRLPFETIGSDLTPYAFLEIFPQDQHERLLIERLSQLGVSVERRTELVYFAEGPDRVVARLRGPDERETDCHATYIAGCDGAWSIVRETMGTGFPGGTYRQIFYVADVDAAGPALNGELHVDLDEADFLAVFPLAGSGRARLIGTVRDARADHAETLEFKDVSDRAMTNLQVQVAKVNLFSTYHVHHRVTDHFRKGRAFLLGDAAHIHSPAGGQGMNTGIGDAINLAWKLAAVLGGRAPDSLLDSYEAERIGFARRLVATISQITLNYRDGPLSQGTAGHVRGGDRLPWVRVDGRDNFETLVAIEWQVHVYGEASEALRKWCVDRSIPLHLFEWRPEHQSAGFERDAVYLLRWNIKRMHALSLG
jgi:2-polyprenyl-6-methoxyphenol hydroxylase-like FAD-dependent oxidoreductase